MCWCLEYRQGVFRDADGVWFRIQSLRLNPKLEFVLVLLYRQGVFQDADNVLESHVGEI